MLTNTTRMPSNQTENNKRTTISRNSSNNSITSQTNTQSNQPITTTFNKTSQTDHSTLTKKRNRNLLRDYYGLTSNTNDIDSDQFNHQIWFKNLTQDPSISLNMILKSLNQIIKEIRELDGQRQSLVYHHHHELVEASVTIGKMKTSAETLDYTLNELQTQFSSISETINSISNSFSTNHPKSIITSPNPISSSKEINKIILPILSLPIILKSLVQQSNKIKSDQLWGEWEISLKSIEDLGIFQIQKVSIECREILKQSRNLSN